MSEYLRELKNYVEATNQLKQLEKDLEFKPLDEQTRVLKRQIRLRQKLNEKNWSKIVSNNPMVSKRKSFW